ncbi:Regulatory protein pchR (fragment) [Capnocytophaga canimorsus]|uniref:Regulatory protein pchR n=1 Tax=Capnocytophaga canimorsus TaxID=28188 RepID=A0A0B7H8A9_9FLAO
MNISLFKNIAQGTAEIFIIDDAIVLIKNQNDSAQMVEFKHEVYQNYIQIPIFKYLKGDSVFSVQYGAVSSVVTRR